MHDDGHHKPDADQEQKPSDPAAGQDVGRHRVLEASKPSLHHLKPDDQQAQPRKSAPDPLPHALAQQVQEAGGQKERHSSDIQIQLEADQRDQPSGRRGADIGAIDDAQRLHHRQKPRADKSHGQHGGRA